ncbi:MAG: hypothetical protein R6U50_14785 [Desulfobacterales bacterium]
MKKLLLFFIVFFFAAGSAFAGMKVEAFGGKTPEKADDGNTSGVYADVWASLDANKFGIVLARGNWNKKAGNGLGEETDFTLLFPNAVPFLLSNYGAATQYPEMADRPNDLTMAQIYARLAVSNKINLIPSLTYFSSNENYTSSLGGPSAGANAYELNLAADYKISDMLTYTAAVAFAKIDVNIGGVDLDEIDSLKWVHKLSLDF